jgi:hypothetical protein
MGRGIRIEIAGTTPKFIVCVGNRIGYEGGHSHKWYPISNKFAETSDEDLAKLILNKIGGWMTDMFDNISKHINNESHEPVKDPTLGRNADPYRTLKGNDLRIFEVVANMCEGFYSNPDIERAFTRKEMEPIVTTIIDQTARGHDFPKNKQYFVFVNNAFGRGYVEVECGLDRVNNDLLEAVEPEHSDHGFPASYGKDIYTYDLKTGAIKYDVDFFRQYLK